MSTPAPGQLAALNSAFGQLQHEQIRPAAFSELARGQTALLDALGPPYAQVLHQLLDRLESGALFEQESCSFSQSELHDSLRLWLNKAAERLGHRA